MHFAFLPRKVATAAGHRRSPTAVGVTAYASAPTTTTATTGASFLSSPQDSHDASAVDTNSSDHATLLAIALSSYALWADPDLRRQLDQSEENYVPLVDLIARSDHLRALKPTQAALVRAIRAHAAGIFDVRMRVVSAPSRQSWFPKRKDEDEEQGGYELRPRDVAAVLARATSITKAEWDAKTIYIENIPHAHRTVAGICHFVRALLAEHEIPSAPEANADHPVEHVHLPPHAQDPPGAPARCKGFALVVLASTAHAERLLVRWPWDARWAAPGQQSATLANEAGAEGEADRALLRVLPKPRWDAMREEYLAHRARLLAAQAPPPPSPPAVSGRSSGPPKRVLPEHGERVTQAAFEEETGPDPRAMAFPPGCLVFVRNVQPQTNKTALRALLSAAFAAGGAEIDYIDFTKGMDTCHLRLAAPEHARTLLEYFTAHPTAQRDGLDNVGFSPGEGDKQQPIALELVEGKKEKVYWERVPEKVRAQAVLKAFGLEEEVEVNTAGQSGGKRKRKRKAQ